MKDSEDELQKLNDEISAYLPYDEFVRIETRLDELRKEEESKLRALEELQKAYLSANTDFEKDYVKQMVGKIREMSRTARAEIRALNQEIVAKNLTLDKAREFFERLQKLSETHNPK